MTSRTRELLEEIFNLPEAELEEFADLFHARLGPEQMGDDPDGEFGQEIQRRIAELESGEVQAIPWSEAQHLMFKSPDDRDS